jgi:hypothetical protein
VFQEVIEDAITGAGLSGSIDLREIAKIRKLVCEAKRAVLDAFADAFELLQRASEISFARRALNRWSIALTLELEIEFDPVLTLGPDAARY